ncbi:MAG: DUF1499 domain-containing protein [Myxococcota bacterium]
MYSMYKKRAGILPAGFRKRSAPPQQPEHLSTSMRHNERGGERVMFLATTLTRPHVTMTFRTLQSALMAVAVVGCTHCAGAPPTTLGLQGGALAPCPSSPNCVSSLATDEEHATASLNYTDARSAAMDRLATIIGAMKGAVIITHRTDYLHAEFTTPLMGFVDDVECHAPEGTSVIHIRSASRIGYSDLGLNRRRVEQIHEAWATSQP